MKSIRRYLEDLLNGITMYRAALYALIAISASAFLFSLTGTIAYSPLRLVLSLAILLPVSYGLTRLFAWTFRSSYNRESWLITALIIFLLVLPPSTLLGAVKLGMIAFLAVASKYFLAWRGRHIFNPAAVAVVISGFVGLGHASWWVATPPLLAIIIVAGGLVVVKTRRYVMADVYILVSFITVAIVALIHGNPVGNTLLSALTSYPIIFLACIMLTEPLSSPTEKKWQYIYAVLVGILGSAQLVYWLTPELALVVGNALAFAVTNRRRLSFTLQSIQQLAPRTYELLLQPNTPFHFKPGQYLELTVPHAHQDSHGTRRMFSIASTSSERSVRLGITEGQTPSSFKKALLSLAPGTELSATHIGGDFTLDQSDRPLVFLAGGIGITPFRAHLQNLLDTSSRRPVTILYAARSEEAFVYTDFFAEAYKKLQFKVVPIVSEPSEHWRGETGRLGSESLQHYVPELQASTIYISGPPAFVDNALATLKHAGVHNRHVKTDYFTGY